jgi:hypothetical protein
VVQRQVLAAIAASACFLFMGPLQCTTVAERFFRSCHIYNAQCAVIGRNRMAVADNMVYRKRTTRHNNLLSTMLNTVERKRLATYQFLASRFYESTLRKHTTYPQVTRRRGCWGGTKGLMHDRVFAGERFEGGGRRRRKGVGGLCAFAVRNSPHNASHARRCVQFFVPLEHRALTDNKIKDRQVTSHKRGESSSHDCAATAVHH